MRTLKGYSARVTCLSRELTDDGTRFRVIRHFLTDDDFHLILFPYAAAISVDRFPECRRVVVNYKLKRGGRDAPCGAPAPLKRAAKC